MARPREFDHDIALQKALRLFQCCGFEATSMRDLTEAMGLSRSSIYATWGEKEALYRAALEHYVAAQAEQIAIVLRAEGSPKAAIAALFQRVLELVLSDREGGCMVVDGTTELALHHPGVAQIMTDNLETNRRAFAEVIRRGQNQGEFDINKDADALAIFLVNAIQGLRVIGKVTDDRQTLEDIVEVTLQILN